MKRNIWLDGIMGVVVGDALGLPVQFKSREELAKHPVTDMVGYGTFNMPPGTWSDDSSLTLATLTSIKECGEVNCKNIMDRFVEWLDNGAYTPFGFAFDEGLTCIRAIHKFKKTRDVDTCGITGEYANGNGALMRIMPVCLWAYEKEINKEWSTQEAITCIHKVSALTHNHLRSKIACGIYYFMMKNILNNEGTLIERLQNGINEALKFYGKDEENLEQLAYYHRLFNLDEFKNVPNARIFSSGYVLDSIEAAVWCLINTYGFEECLLKAANLGEDTDTVAAISGGLAGLFYGYHNIKDSWKIMVEKNNILAFKQILQINYYIES